MASTVRPMQSALLPQLAKTPEELTAANLVLTTVESSGIFLGPALGGILLAATNTQTVFAAAAVAFVGASALLVGLKVEAAPERDVEGNFMREFFGGFGAIASDRKLRADRDLVRNPDVRRGLAQRPDRRRRARAARPRAGGSRAS